jgi:hypothetical protein
MIAIVSVAVFAAILFAIARAQASSKDGPSEEAARIVAEANATSDPARLDAYAAELDRLGFPQAAAAVRERAARIRAGTKALPAAGTRTLKSPVAEASGAAWTRFVELAAAGNQADNVTPGGYLGMFAFGLPRLADLGFVTNLRKDPTTGRRVADWVPPLTQEKFLADPQVQYEAFVKSVQADRRAVVARHQDAIGKVLAGKVATLSGLLGAARQAGLKGLADWLASDADRTRFPSTSAAYLRSNGLF